MNPRISGLLGLSLGGGNASADPFSFTSESTLSDFNLYLQEPVITQTGAGRDVVIKDTSMPELTDPDKASIDGEESRAGYTAFQIRYFASGISDLVDATASIANGYIANKNYEMQANKKEFVANQNLRAAELLKQNIRDINRAADADANVYRFEGVKTKSAQKVAMAESGFAVGEGTYKVLLDTTDARKNFNASMIMLKAGLQNAEVLRQAGGLKAQAIIDKSDADIYRAMGEYEIAKGWGNALSKLFSSGANFTIAYKGA